MNLQLIGSNDLIKDLKKLVSEERFITTQILHFLVEVEARLLHAELGYSSLYDFCLKELGYCHGSAHLRISAMRFLKKLPESEKRETEEKLQAGKLNLSGLAMIQSHLKQQHKTTGIQVSQNQTLELLAKIESKSTRETEKILMEGVSEVAPREKLKLVSQTQTQITFTVKESVIEKVQRVRDIRAHVKSHESYAELFESLVDFYLKHKDPLMKAERASNRMANTIKVPPIENDVNLRTEDAMALYVSRLDACSSVARSLEFGGSGLVSSELESSELENSELESSELESSELENSELENSELENSELQNSELENSELENSELESSELESSELESSELESSELENSELESSELESSELESSELESSELESSALDGLEFSTSEPGGSELDSLGSGNSDLHKSGTKLVKHHVTLTSHAHDIGVQANRSRFIPAAVKHSVRLRDRGRCTFIHPQTHRACGATYGLEIDHIIPFGQGGETSVQNLRLRCRAHNSLHALKSYGRIYVPSRKVG